MVDLLTVGEDNAHVGLIRFAGSQKLKVEFGLQLVAHSITHSLHCSWIYRDSFDKDFIKDGIKNARFIGGTTDIANALEVAAEVCVFIVWDSISFCGWIIRVLQYIRHELTTCSEDSYHLQCMLITVSSFYEAFFGGVEPIEKTGWLFTGAGRAFRAWEGSEGAASVQRRLLVHGSNSRFVLPIQCWAFLKLSVKVDAIQKSYLVTRYLDSREQTYKNRKRYLGYT